MVDPYEMFEVLKGRAKSPRTKKSLNVIQNICEEQFQRGSRDFSISMICQLGEERGVPSYRTIVNKDGKMYRELIKTWQENHPKAPIQRRAPKKFDWLESIDCSRTKWLVNELIQENKKLTAELQLSKKITKLEIDMRPRKASMTTASALSKSPAVSKLLPQEVKALSTAIDDEYLSQFGLSAGKAGSVVDSKERVVFKAGFISAVRKSLAVANEEKSNG